MRTVHNARYIFGTIILTAHFLAIGLYAFEVTYGGLISTDSNDYWPAMLGVSSLLPLTGIYATTFWRYVVNNPHIPPDQKTDPMDSGPFYLQLIMILMFSAALLGLIYITFKNPLITGGYNNIPSIVSLMEMLFGAFIGLTFSALFPLQWEQGGHKTP